MRHLLFATLLSAAAALAASGDYKADVAGEIPAEVAARELEPTRRAS